MSPTKKETVEYDASFLESWHRFCESRGFSKRQAAHAARLAFMRMLSADQREGSMADAMPMVLASRRPRQRVTE